MTAGRLEREWARTAALMAVVHNMSGFAERPLAPDDFNPMARAADDPEPSAEDVKANWNALRGLVTGGGLR